MSPRDVIRLVAGSPTIEPLIVRSAAECEARPVRWLWPRRIARGKLTVLAGHPGLGKSQAALAIAAIVTTCGRWPVSGERAERGAVVILSAEDDPADTIRPRLEAAGGDLGRCYLIEAAQDMGADGKPRRRGFSVVDDLPRLDAQLRRIGDVALIIIDPITAYLGAIDSHRNAEVRAALAPLADLAAQHGAAILAISHLRKSLAGEAVLQVIGSLAFGAAARAVYLVTRDPEDRERRLFCPQRTTSGTTALATPTASSRRPSAAVSRHAASRGNRSRSRSPPIRHWRRATRRARSGSRRGVRWPRLGCAICWQLARSRSKSWRRRPRRPGIAGHLCAERATRSG